MNMDYPQLLDHVLHELRSPLSTVVLGLDALKRRASREKVQAPDLRRFEIALQRLQRALDHAADVGAVSIRLESVIVEVRAVVREAVAQVDHAVVVTVADDVPTKVVWDGRRCASMLSSVFAGFRALAPAAQLSLAVHWDGVVYFRCGVTASGVSDAIIHYLRATPCFEAAPPYALGLAAAYRIMVAHDGSLRHVAECEGFTSLEIGMPPAGPAR